MFSALYQAIWHSLTPPIATAHLVPSCACVLCTPIDNLTASILRPPHRWFSHTLVQKATITPELLTVGAVCANFSLHLSVLPAPLNINPDSFPRIVLPQGRCCQFCHKELPETFSVRGRQHAILFDGVRADTRVSRTMYSTLPAVSPRLPSLPATFRAALAASLSSIAIPERVRRYLGAPLPIHSLLSCHFRLLGVPGEEYGA